MDLTPGESCIKSQSIKHKKLSLFLAISAQKCERINSHKCTNEGSQPENALSNKKSYAVNLAWLSDRNDRSQPLLPVLNQ